ncbi:MAG: FAD-dependent oxidoreductase [Bdellovibrionia bacterium]
MDLEDEGKFGSPIKPEDLNDPGYQQDLVRPVLTDTQIEAVRTFGEEIELDEGRVLFRRGDRNIDFFVVLEGVVDVYETDSAGKHHVVLVHQHGNFTGELNLFNSRKCLVSARVSRKARLICVKRKSLRRMLVSEPEIASILLQTAVYRRLAFIRLGMAGITLIGDYRDPSTLRIRRFLVGNNYPHRIVSPDAPSPDGKSSIMESLGLRSSDLPTVWDSKERVYKNPTVTQLAIELGLQEEPLSGQVYDLIIVGAGPSGLAASVYAASEGLDTLLFETLVPGGQAGTSSRIENYLGFPHGVSGLELATLATLQAQKFGAQIAVAQTVTNISQDSERKFKITLKDQSNIYSRSVIVASGAQYRKLDLEGYERFEGRGLHYAATPMEAQLCTGEEVVIVGGGNSAGQAALFLSLSVSRVHMLVRGETLSSTMSSYLAERIKASYKIKIYYETEIKELSGDNSLEQVTWQCSRRHEVWQRPIQNVFVMIGAVPNTEWMQGCVELDKNGFILTGRVRPDGSRASPYETSVPGLFAVGDVRAESVKRVASAVGEGSVVVQWVHKYLSAQVPVASVSPDETGAHQSAA